ncbi:MAG: PPOX class F420-dependent oxidoreductase [Chloroflexota bacterium]|nr:PPOX class F420-dependent oxidoreductase [Chloroflexota bacterium]
MSEMFSERQLRFVEKPRIGRLATVRRDGSPHVAPVWYRFDAGAFLVLTERGSQKHRNIERDPRVEFCIDDERPPYHTVLVHARVTVEEAPGREWREALAIHYLGEEAGRRYIAENMHPNDVMLRIAPEKVTGW